jgi:hypothetical protein
VADDSLRWLENPEIIFFGETGPQNFLIFLSISKTGSM